MENENKNAATGYIKLTLLTVVYYTFTTVSLKSPTFTCSTDYLLFFFEILKGNLRS